MDKITENMDKITEKTENTVYSDVDDITEESDEISSGQDKLKDLIPNIKDMGMLSSIFKMFVNFVPDNVWKLTAESTLNKICETVRDADTAKPGDTDSAGCVIKMEIVKQVNTLISALIEGINKEKLKEKIMDKIMEKLDDPLNDFNEDCVALKIMDSLLTQRKSELVDFLTKYFTSEYIRSQPSQEDDAKLLNFVNLNDINKYFEYLSKQEVTALEDEEVDVKEGEVVVNEGEVDVNKGQGISDGASSGGSSYKINQNGGSIGEVVETAELAAEAAQEVIKSFDELMRNMIKNIMSEAANDASGTESDDSDKKVFLKASDMSNRILNAANFHLEKPEGRQIYLRQIEKLLSRSINDISDFHPLMIPLFKKCLDNGKFNTVLEKTIDNTVNINDTSRVENDKILAIKHPFKIEETEKHSLELEILEFLEKLHNNVKEELEKINPVENIYNEIKGSKCKTYGSIPEETINHKRKLDEERDEETINHKRKLDEERDEETIADNTNVDKTSADNTKVADNTAVKTSAVNTSTDDKTGGNNRKSRNKKYLPKKQKQTRKKYESS